MNKNKRSISPTQPKQALVLPTAESLMGIREKFDALFVKVDERDRIVRLIIDTLRELTHLVSKSKSKKRRIAEVELINYCMDLFHRPRLKKTEQPMPANACTVWSKSIQYDLVQRLSATSGIRDLIKLRAKEGLRRYGSYLMKGNGRDTMKDLLDELADASVYAELLKQEHPGDSDIAHFASEVLFTFNLVYEYDRKERIRKTAR